MSEADYETEGGESSRVPSRLIVEAMEETNRYRQEWINAYQAGEGNNERLLRGFHAAVINYYILLSNHKDKTAIKDDWDDIKLWVDESGEPVTGMDTLDHWIDRQRPVEQTRAGRRRGGSQTVTAAYLPPRKLLAASRALDELADELGFGPRVSESTPRTEIDEDLIEEWEEWRQQNIN